MVEAVTTGFHRLPPLLLLLVFPSTVFGHRLDEYLQATLVSIEPSGVRLQINLTPGVAVSGQVLAGIDRDRDGVISGHEAGVYAELLRRDLEVRLDQRRVELELIASNFPEPAELRGGLGIIQMEFSAMGGPLAAGEHRLTLNNRHRPAASAYLFNAALPKSDAVRIIRQKRNKNQSVAEIEFAFHPQRRVEQSGAPPLPPAPMRGNILPPSWRRCRGTDAIFTAAASKRTDGRSPVQARRQTEEHPRILVPRRPHDPWILTTP